MHMRLWNAVDGKEICFFKGNFYNCCFTLILNMFFGVYMDFYSLYVTIVVSLMSWHNYICGGMYVQQKLRIRWNGFCIPAVSSKRLLVGTLVNAQSKVQASSPTG